LQHSVDKIQQWSDIWKLKLNINKCKVVCYGIDRSNQGNYHMTIDNKDIILEQVDHFKDLFDNHHSFQHSVVIAVGEDDTRARLTTENAELDNHLSFQHHCSEKVNKAYSILGIIKRNFTHLTTEA
jgi:hypothetical protein